jgi:DNA repair photolyase
MRVHYKELKSGINRTPEFEKKQLASYSINVGIKCGHGCLYCSTGAMLRTHILFRECGENPFGFGYAIVDPNTPTRVEKDAKRIKKRGLVQLCTTVDAWAPEAQEFDLGRKCLKAVLSQPGWTVRILTKNAAVLKEFDMIEKYKDRVLIGTSITATQDKSGVISIIEPQASSIQERMVVLREARARGFRTYAMFCPLLPGIADSPEQIDRLVQFASEIQAEGIFAEPVNARGPGLRLTQEALQKAGFDKEAAAVGSVRKQKNWSRYTATLISNIQRSVYRFQDINRLRILLYPSNLKTEELKQIKKDDRGVIWLGKNGSGNMES